MPISPAAADVVPLFAALLSLPLPGDTIRPGPEPAAAATADAAALLALLWGGRAAAGAVSGKTCTGSTPQLECLASYRPGPTARLLTLCTFARNSARHGRAARISPRSPSPLHASPGRGDGDRVANGKALPGEVVEQVVAKTDGVPLFVEELTKMVLESGLLQEQRGPLCAAGSAPSRWRFPPRSTTRLWRGSTASRR